MLNVLSFAISFILLHRKHCNHFLFAFHFIQFSISPFTITLVFSVILKKLSSLVALYYLLCCDLSSFTWHITVALPLKSALRFVVDLSSMVAYWRRRIGGQVNLECRKRTSWNGRNVTEVMCLHSQPHEWPTTNQTAPRQRRANFSEHSRTHFDITTFLPKYSKWWPQLPKCNIQWLAGWKLTLFSYDVNFSKTNCAFLTTMHNSL